MNEALLTILSLLVGSLIWTVKALVGRSDRMVEVRDIEVQRSLRSLEAAVDAFRKFEAHEHDIHSKLITSMEMLAKTQEQTLERLESLDRRLSTSFPIPQPRPPR